MSTRTSVSMRRRATEVNSVFSLTCTQTVNLCSVSITLFFSPSASFFQADIVSLCVSSSSPSQPHSRSVITPRIPPSDAGRRSGKENSTPSPRCVTMETGNKFELILGKSSAQAVILRPPPSTHEGTRWRSMSVCNNTLQQAVFGQRRSPPRPSRCAAGGFHGQWSHLSGPAQCEQSPPKQSVSVKDKSEKKRGEKEGRLSGRKECSMWPSWILGKKQPLIEMCESQVFLLK